MAITAQAEDEVMSTINITPFTDVLLVLLIIFMILAAIITPPGFEKELPNNNNSNQSNNDKHNEIDVLVNNKGVIFVDQTRTDVNGIYGVMQATEQKRGKKHVSITADAKAPYGVIIRILDASKLAGLDDVGFVTAS
ncbi:MAG: biopolymer transporter ExbD [Candidatus Eremiobacteraeota bacterium]|nr:biopolymer transporter ExbD [Candidatus Eremiobacteraeota bacterium]